MSPVSQNKNTPLRASPENADAAVLEHSLLSPFTLYPAGASIIGGVAATVFSLNPITGGVVLGGLGIAATNFGINYFFRSDTIKQRYFEDFYKKIEAKRQNTVEVLRNNLNQLINNPDPKIANYSAQGQQQFYMADERFNTVKSLLGSKLEKGELTYIRYLGAAEEVVLSVLDNLDKAVSMLKSSSAIDLNYIKDRKESLEKLSSPSKADEREFKTLLDRENLFNNQFELINELLTDNEIAITRLDELNASLAEVTIKKGRSRKDLDAAIEEMKELADRISHYEE